MLYRFVAAFAFAMLNVHPVPAQEHDSFSAQRRHQAIGRVLIDPNGRFIVYEWQRPFDWRPGTAGLPSAVAARPQTTLYRIEIPEIYLPTDPPTSRELFVPNPGATCYLGNLSADAAQVSFYEIDRDTNAARAGIVATSAESTPALTWFSMPPDVTRLSSWPQADGANSWSYPVAGGFARADALSGQAAACTSCFQSHPAAAPAGATAERIEGLPSGARLVAAASRSDISVYIVDRADMLGLYYVRAGRLRIIFENRR